MKRVVLERLAMVQGIQYSLLAIAEDGTDHMQVMVKQGNHLIASLPYQNRAPDEALDMVLDDLDLIVRRLPLGCESRLPVYVGDGELWRLW